MNKTAICIGLLLSCQAWALSCTEPVTLPQPGQMANRQPRVAINEEGEALALWTVSGPDSDDDVLVAATMNTEKKWVSVAISEPIGETWKYRPFIDANGNCFAFWENENEDDESEETLLYKFAKKEKNKAWTPAVNISEDGLKYSKYDFDSQGNVLLIGRNEVKDPIETWRTKTHIVAANYLHQKGEKKQTVISTFDGYLRDKNLISNGEGNFFALWNENSLKGSWLQGDGVWTSPVTITQSDSYFYDFEAVMNSKKDLAILYEKSNAIKVVTCFDGQWSEPLDLAVEGDFEDLNIILNDDGQMIASWVKTEKGKDVIYIAEKPAKQPWSSPVALSDPSKTASSLHISMDGIGNAMVVWAVKEGIKWVPFAAYKPVNQDWVSPVRLTDGTKTCKSIQVEVNNLGYFAIIWEEHRVKHASIHGATFSTDTQQWSSSKISPQGQDCKDFVFEFNKKGQGIIAWRLYGTDDISIQVAELNVN